MRDALIVMNPRQVPECMDAFAALDIDVLYLRGYTERQIASHGFADALAHDYDWFWVASDDIIVRPHALQAVRELAEDGHPVVTGYSQRSHTEWVVNLTSERLHGDVPNADAYAFRDFAEVVAWPDPVVPTGFAGMSVTGMSRELWERFPFDCYGDPGYASDFNLSVRLRDADIPIVAARDAFAYHWRHDWVNTNDERDESPRVGACELVADVKVAA